MNPFTLSVFCVMGRRRAVWMGQGPGVRSNLECRLRPGTASGIDISRTRIPRISISVNTVVSYASGILAILTNGFRRSPVEVRRLSHRRARGVPPVGLGVAVDGGGPRPGLVSGAVPRRLAEVPTDLL